MRRGYASILVVDRKMLNDYAYEMLRLAIVERAKRGSNYISPRDIEKLAREKGFDEYTSWRIATIVGMTLSRYCPRVRNARPRLYRITTELLCELFDVCSYAPSSEDPIQLLYNKIALLFEAEEVER